MTLVATDAVVLHLFDYLESSRIVRLATRDLGVQAVLARGARRPKSRFGHSLDLFASGVAQFYARPGRDLHTLGGFEVTRSRLGIAEDLDRFAAASALAELALRVSHGDPHGDDTFVVLTESLDALAVAPPGTATDLGLAYAWRFVAALGFGPAVEICCVCHAEVPAGEPAPFSHAGGGIVCRRCAVSTPVSRALPADARLALRRWIAGARAELAGDADRRAHLRLLREFLHHHLTDGRELRALDAWEASRRRTA
jgi:DNA repair protein RecO (recombination protein O)